jgi:hypothetical protein
LFEVQIAVFFHLGGIVDVMVPSNTQIVFDTARDASRCYVEACGVVALLKLLFLKN